MHPFTANPTCPKCQRLVYAAEQVMGPGRKLYHKPCLTCTTCNKRLETSTLLEHDLEPYCKLCHLKNFGTRDLRHANLPNALPPPGNNDCSQISSQTPSPAKNSFSSQPLLRPLSTGGTPLPRLKPNRSLTTSPISPTFLRGSSPTSPAFQVPSSSTPTTSENNQNNNTIHEEDETEVRDALITGNDEREEDRNFVPESNTSSPYPSHTGRPGIGTIPRTIPLYLNNGNGSRTGYNNHYSSHSVGSVPSNYSPTKGEGEETENHPATKNFLGSVTHNTGDGMALDRNLGAYGNFTPLKQTSTGTRYGVALTGGVGVHATGSASPSPRKWGAGTPVCPRCTKSVYFAEQVKAVGKTFHKTCLRCVECGTSLDSNKLLDHDGDPFCVRCHNKLYGPQGNGYALLGKAGG